MALNVEIISTFDVTKCKGDKSGLWDLEIKYKLKLSVLLR